MRIIVDAMGGDHAPEVVVEGAVAAIKEYDVQVTLVGDEDRINVLLKKYRYNPSRISVHPATEVVEMGESAATSFRRKRNSSIVLGLKLVKDGSGDAFFSAGNTGAVVCAATLTLGMLPGIERPGIAIIMPTLKGASLIIDVGANIDPKPTQLLQYGIMAEAYCRCILNRPKPKVALLNIGEEDSKGTGFIKEARELFEKSALNFIGNVEGRDIFTGVTDVIVCDGFVGNVTLKVAESLAETLLIFLKENLLSSFSGKVGALLLKPALKKFKKRVDYSEYGGAPLLGV
ncbi:MAG: phosphate acyltransferase PlsX, partial [Candidatus Omnitrophica bacterium]|nr:phosphate acyltransferase PlsX [Candidatus Omnitrophota bacterium]